MKSKIGVGIDTGGTYTDAVIYSFDEKKVLGTAKALTTKQDLSAGILEALDKLPAEMLRKAELISLSTTLATNACVEDKGGRARLIFFGGDEKVINEFGPRYGLPPAEDIHIQESYTGFSGKVSREPDWDLFEKSMDEGFSRLDGAGIIEIYSMKNNAVVEKKAKEIFQRKFDIPVVCGHELFSGLNCLQRGAGALLNARLFPVIKEFLLAIKKSLAQRNIGAQVVIVRSDGSLMSQEFAEVRPVETLLCGPAASVAGGSWLSGEANAVIVDMGGTTTDIALVKDGAPVKVIDGVTIGKWKTFVHGFYIKTFGLGGDSAVHYFDYNVFIEDYRVVPLCVAASAHPRIIDNLRRLVDSSTAHSFFLHEQYLLVNGMKDEARYTETEKRFCAALRNGPLPLKEAAAAVGTDIYNFNVSRLLREGIVQICGLTPTDIMHIRNHFSGYSREAALLGAEFAAYNTGLAVDELCEKVYDEVKRKLYVNIVKILLENQERRYFTNGVDSGAEQLILQSYESAKRGGAGNIVTPDFRTGFTLVGIGAPIKIFLDDVAGLLGTRAVIPEHYEVANALGAVVGNIYASCSVELRPNYTLEGITGYTVFGYSGRMTFKTLEQAREFAAAEAEAGAREEAVKRGARGAVTVMLDTHTNEGSARGGAVYLGTTVTAHASNAVESREHYSA
ncbi:MAG: hydantoinase/oxoprolinase family protein [Treponema sp.]|jgi:N-methylhydantoinase A/oxoprolinase/acetone carboxylase beta subunit|nr:hydantoinase/oxoprolinase family protein [Treponema sp.]